LAVFSTSNSARISSTDFFSLEGILPPSLIRGASAVPGIMAMYSEPIKVGLSTIATESLLILDE
jgi:hypothetical protein